MHLVSHSPHVTHQLTSLLYAMTVTCDSMWCDHNMIILWLLSYLLWLCDCHMIFPMLYLSNNLKEKKEKKEILNNNLAILPSHDNL